MKTCSECRRSLPIEEFYRHPHTADGYEGRCKDCKRGRRNDQYRDQSVGGLAQRAEFFAGWCIVFSEPNREDDIEKHLADGPVEVFLPKCRIMSKRGLGPAEPLFPRYLFALLADGNDYDTVRSTSGVAYILKHAGGRVATLSEEAVGIIRQRVEQDGGAVTIDPNPTFAKDDRVKITDGSFAGHEGLFVRAERDRIVVLLEILGRETMVKLGCDLIEPRRD